MCIVYPLMEGGDLESALCRLPPLSPSARLQLAADCAEGLAALHEQRVCHRDFKPANVLLRADGRAVCGATMPAAPAARPLALAALALAAPPLHRSCAWPTTRAAASAARHTAAAGDWRLRPVPVPGRPHAPDHHHRRAPTAAAPLPPGPAARTLTTRVMRMSPSPGAPATRAAGTDSYIDPSYRESGELTLASDMYGYGLTLLRLLTGRALFTPGLRPPGLLGRCAQLLRDARSAAPGVAAAAASGFVGPPPSLAWRRSPWLSCPPCPPVAWIQTPGLGRRRVRRRTPSAPYLLPQLHRRRPPLKPPRRSA